MLVLDDLGYSSSFTPSTEQINNKYVSRIKSTRNPTTREKTMVVVRLFDGDDDYLKKTISLLTTNYIYMCTMAVDVVAIVLPFSISFVH